MKLLKLLFYVSVICIMPVLDSCGSGGGGGSEAASGVPVIVKLEYNATPAFSTSARPPMGNIFYEDDDADVVGYILYTDTGGILLEDGEGIYPAGEALGQEIGETGSISFSLPVNLSRLGEQKLGVVLVDSKGQRSKRKDGKVTVCDTRGTNVFAGQDNLECSPL